jgi:hypothetical protein
VSSAEGIVAKRKPGRKSGLPPRSPNALWLFGLTIDRLNAIDFASDAVIKPLKGAGWALDEFDGIPDEIAAACLNNRIREIVAYYISIRVNDRRRDAPLAKIRNAVAKLERDVGKLIRQLRDEPGSDVSAFDRMVVVAKLASDVAKLPNEVGSAVDRVVVEALNSELAAIDCEQAPDLAFVREGLDALQNEQAPDLACIRAGLDALQNAARRIRIDEAGAGKPHDRIALELVRGLGVIFKERTGNISSSPSGRFAQFVNAVNDLIPEGFRLDEARDTLDHLIAPAANITS